MSNNENSFISKQKRFKKVLLFNSYLIFFFSFNGFFKGEYIYYKIGIWMMITFCLYGYALYKRIFDFKLALIYFFITTSLIGITYYFLFKNFKI
jgi:hypothetical protein